MADIGLVQFAKMLGTKSVSGMAQKLGLHWPPPPSISVRNLQKLAGRPLQPANLSLSYVIGGVGSSHAPDSHDVPVTGVALNWDDPGVFTLRAGKYWQVSLKNASTGQDFGSATLGSRGYIITLPFEHDTPYSWSVVAVNDFGQGPSTPVYTFRTVAAARGILSLKVGPVVLIPGTLQVVGVTWTLTPAWGGSSPITLAGASAQAIPSPLPSGQTHGQIAVQLLVTLEVAGVVDGIPFPDQRFDAIQSPPSLVSWAGSNLTAGFLLTYTVQLDTNGNPQITAQTTFAGVN